MTNSNDNPWRWRDLSRVEKCVLISGASVGTAVWIFLRINDADHRFNPLRLLDLVMLVGFGWVFAGVVLSLGDYAPAGRAMAVCGAMLLILGFGGFMAGFFFATGSTGFIPRSFEMPLGDLEPIAMDAAGRIYTGAGFYSRVQVYDPSGRFLHGWFVDAGGGHFDMRINEEDLLEVHAVRPDKVYVFNSEGQLLTTRAVSPHFQFGPNHETGQAKDSAGNVYKVRARLLFPHVMKVTPDGRATTVVSVPWYKWVWMGPLPAWGFGMIGMVLLGLADKMKKTKPAGYKVPVTLKPKAEFAEKVKKNEVSGE